MCFEERFILDKNSKKNIIYNEHLIRYELAKKFVSGKIVLDIACGSGFGAKILARAGAEKVTAVDIDEKTVKKARNKNWLKNIVYRQGNAENLAEKNETFDIIVSFETIEHLKNPEKYLKELKRVIKNNGLIFISTPNKKISKEKNPFHFKEFEKEEFKEILSKYFKSILLLEQNNGIATFIKAPEKRKQSEFLESGAGEPLYFIAVCSNWRLPDIEKNVISVNPSALSRLYNNPALKTTDKIYGLADKFFKIFK